jgi:hypothetical protein
MYETVVVAIWFRFTLDYGLQGSLSRIAIQEALIP